MLNTEKGNIVDEIETNKANVIYLITHLFPFTTGCEQKCLCSSSRRNEIFKHI